MVTVGVIGAGRIGEMHAENLATRIPDAALVAIADIYEPAATSVARRLSIPAVATDYREVLERPEIDAVVICSATASHTAVIKNAAEAGKHIFCEKPLSLTLEGCDEAIAAVQEAGVELQVGFMRRFDPPYVEARRKIEAGEIGDPVMFKSTGRDPKRTSLDFARRENSGGLIADMGVHEFDLARWLVGREIDRVHSEGGCLVYPELADVGDIDNAVINLRFDAGAAIGNVDVSRNAVYGYDIRTEVIGTNGSVWIGQIQQTGLLTLTADGVVHDTFPGFVERFREAYLNEMNDFIARIRSGRPASVTGEDARAATVASLAATRSLDEGRPVSIAEIEGKTSAISA